MVSGGTLIAGGRIVDGTGNPWRHGDLLLLGDRIAALTAPGRVDRSGIETIIDASDLVVAPGFIDIQSHSIIPLMVDGRCLSKITQGVTAEIMGEAWTPAPFGGRVDEAIPRSFAGHEMAEWEERARGWPRFGHWLEAMEERGVSPNIGSFLGGGTLRQYVRGMDMGRSSDEDLDAMRRVMADAMEDGALGVSYALIYPPDSYVDTDEIASICEVVAAHGGIYITHIRSESDRLLESIDEAVEIGRRSGAPVEIYHLKASARRNWDKMPVAIARIDAARAAGIDVTADMYPYPAAGTGLSSLFPDWVSAGGRFYENVKDPDVRRGIREDIAHTAGEWDETRPEGIMPVGFHLPENAEYVGKRLSEIAAARGTDWLDTAADLLAGEGQRIFTIFFSMTEENLALEIRQPWIKIASDAGGIDPAWAEAQGPTHPRAYGTFTRVLAKYVRDEGIITLEDAVRKMSSAVAERLHIYDRGVLRPGAHADVITFDPSTVSDRATFDAPHRLSTGVRDVWVNGARVLKNGEHTGALPGRFLRNGS